MFRFRTGCAYDPAVMSNRPALLLPDIPVLVAGLTRAIWIDQDGEIEELDKPTVRQRLRQGPPPLLCHAPSVARRLETPGLIGFDILELFAFVRPAQFCLPTARGVALALRLGEPDSLEDQALALIRAMKSLLLRCHADADGEAVAIARRMAEADWPWAPFVLDALASVSAGARGLAVWRDLPEIPEHAPEPPATHHPIPAEDARRRLAELVGDDAETRAPQAEFAATAASAFAPRKVPGEPAFVIAEAGTGVGKTLGYLAPASLWAERNDGTVWVSTYTRNLQHQIDGELDRVYPDPAQKPLQAVLRKGRENYLCLLNLEEAVQGLPGRPSDGVALGLMARWVAASRDGDLSGGDFPGWLAELVGRPRTVGLADRRGECIYAACPHYDRCFIERSLRRGRRARIVVANHALVMMQAALGGEDGAAPQRVVFDEGHHLFDAADGAFSAHLSGAEGQEVRRWVLGAEGGRSRSRGLRRRIEDLLPDQASADSLDVLLRAARALPGEGWPERLIEDRAEGVVESLLATIRRQVLARQSQGGDGGVYSIEADLHPLDPDIAAAADDARPALELLKGPADLLRRRLMQRLEDEAEDLDTATRLRIEAAARSIERRVLLPVAAWADMLAALAGAPTPKEMVDWLSIERFDGRDIDVGMHRHWIDPMRPFARHVAGNAHGVLVTSATLTDSTGREDLDWLTADQRSGAVYLPVLPVRRRLVSPFNYPDQTRVLIVNDVRKDDMAQVAAAYRALFLAAGGGGLGLFTAISRLRAVHTAIAAPLEQAGLPLFAQHVDGLETSTLIDIFRAEENSCLLGTDAVRDGVDVPGRSLRLIVFDRVPWPRPDILHRARRNAFGGRFYDDRITRLRLKQAFGRLVRRAGDHGVFVLLDPMMPSRLLSAFPPGVSVQRVGLAEAVAVTRDFLNTSEIEQNM